MISDASGFFADGSAPAAAFAKSSSDPEPSVCAQLVRDPNYFDRSARPRRTPDAMRRDDPRGDQPREEAERLKRTRPTLFHHSR